MLYLSPYDNINTVLFLLKALNNEKKKSPKIEFDYII